MDSMICFWKTRNSARVGTVATVAPARMYFQAPACSPCRALMPTWTTHFDSSLVVVRGHRKAFQAPRKTKMASAIFVFLGRSEEHTSELQSRGHLVCRLLLEKKKTGTSRRDTKR